MAARASSPRCRAAFASGLLAASALLAAVIWRPAALDEAQPAPPPVPVGAAPVPRPATEGVGTSTVPPEPPAAAAELPQLRVPAAAAGQDPLAAALQAAGEIPQPPPPAAIASAKTLEQAFAAMVAAQADTVVPAGTSPFGPR